MSQLGLIRLALQRVVLMSYNAASKRISMRHYSIHSAPSGVSKGAKSVAAGRALPSLAELDDVSELLLRSGYGSVRLATCSATKVAWLPAWASMPACIQASARPAQPGSLDDTIAAAMLWLWLGACDPMQPAAHGQCETFMHRVVGSQWRVGGMRV